jgi:hypothetical protein
VTFGYYTLAVEPVAEACLAIAQREVGRCIIFLDPNIRPTVISDTGRQGADLPTACDVEAVLVGAAAR